MLNKSRESRPKKSNFNTSERNKFYKNTTVSNNKIQNVFQDVRDGQSQGRTALRSKRKLQKIALPYDFKRPATR